MVFKLKVNPSAIRVILVACNVIFSILSLGLIALAVVYMDDFALSKQYDGIQFIEASTLLIIVGALSFIASLGGCYCFKNENPKVVCGFLTYLCLLLLIELLLAVMSFFKFGGTQV